MRTSRLSLLVSLAAGGAAVLLSVTFLRPPGTADADDSSDTDAPTKSAAMTAEEFESEESSVWPPGEGIPALTQAAEADDGEGDGGGDGLPEGWRTIETDGLVLPIHNDWEKLDPEETPFPEGTESVYSDPVVGGLQVLSGYPADQFDAHQAVVRFVNEISPTGEVLSTFTPVDAPPGLHGAAYAEFALHPADSELEEAAGGSLSGVLFGVQIEEGDDPLVLWWEWPTEGAPGGVQDIVTGGVRPAD
ncbi:hypothetical protein [Nocardiopsis baichengensis]|uniref:hypothetical protein n=1 Tax=Nocardiopsis baichengensis TaxID=280240 RepID=UPI00034C9FCB|nr:hypothetical protein [Nocardiopsis baichengensis]